jgi:hypothetical protein
MVDLRWPYRPLLDLIAKAEGTHFQFVPRAML